MKQREQALRIVRELGWATQAGSMESLCKELRDVVAKAQNGLPDGEADRSINEELWKELSSVENALRLFLGPLSRLMELTDELKEPKPEKPASRFTF